MVAPENDLTVLLDLSSLVLTPFSMELPTSNVACFMCFFLVKSIGLSLSLESSVNRYVTAYHVA